VSTKHIRAANEHGFAEMTKKLPETASKSARKQPRKRQAKPHLRVLEAKIASARVVLDHISCVGYQVWIETDGLRLGSNTSSREIEMARSIAKIFASCNGDLEIEDRTIANRMP
jgi:hypothetical protein